jgi:hypothetical protein
MQSWQSWSWPFILIICCSSDFFENTVQCMAGAAVPINFVLIFQMLLSWPRPLCWYFRCYCRDHDLCAEILDAVVTMTFVLIFRKLSWPWPLCWHFKSCHDHDYCADISDVIMTFTTVLIFQMLSWPWPLCWQLGIRRVQVRNLQL